MKAGNRYYLNIRSVMFLAAVLPFLLTYWQRIARTTSRTLSQGPGQG